MATRQRALALVGGLVAGLAVGVLLAWIFSVGETASERRDGALPPAPATREPTGP